MVITPSYNRRIHGEECVNITRHENFQEKAGIPAFLVKIYVFSFLFMMFWAFLIRFPAFLFKVILMPALHSPFIDHVNEIWLFLIFLDCVGYQQ